MNNFFPPIDRWHLSPEVLRLSFEEMALDGKLGNEGTCLWLGLRENGQAKIKQIVLLRGRGVHKKPAHLRISDELMYQVGELASNAEQVVLAQIHSHGPGHGTDLSITDHTYGFMVPYFVSIVAPDYSLWHVPLEQCGVHVFGLNEGYKRLSSREVANRFKFDATLRTHLSIVGGSEL